MRTTHNKGTATVLWRKLLMRARTSSRIAVKIGMSWVHRDPPEPVERPLVKLKVMSQRRFQELQRILREARMNEGRARPRQKRRS